MEDAIRHLQNLTRTVYLYKRQQYDDIAEIAGSDIIKRFGLQRKTIEQRIRKDAEGRLKESDLANSLLKVHLDDAVFKPSQKTEIEGPCRRARTARFNQIVLMNWSAQCCIKI